MEYLIYLGCTALLAGLVLYVGYPLVASREPNLRIDTTYERHLLERQERVYTAIKELEFDQKLGKVPPEEARTLLAELEAEALRILQQLEHLEGHTRALMAHVEKDLLVLRPCSAAENQPPGTQLHCPACGLTRRSEDRFCPGCGTRLPDKT